MPGHTNPSPQTPSLNSGLPLIVSFCLEEVLAHSGSPDYATDVADDSDSRTGDGLLRWDRMNRCWRGQGRLTSEREDDK
ncbi:uncharacterized protein ColSpa_08167 [Colletotrichum spaethianum]|uniref:Uncharacterized protein n=1 Tax=Colletotrichum spaethianum TaxID=700344 RepID=A0AA37UJG9_9PEZI|nr:uncharacterized protein ColSpa_08167 [Colletotrichum spaethianum]GKT47986.1 hypothetical protein ColSpa_08167 [Colletotrichum spaethianum]